MAGSAPQTADLCGEQGAPAPECWGERATPHRSPEWELTSEERLKPWAISEAVMKRWQWPRLGSGFPLQLPGRRLSLRALGEGRGRFSICWFSPACTVKIVFREYSEVELAVTAANRIHPPVYFTRLMDTWLHGLAFQKERKENKSQRSLILPSPGLPWPPLASPGQLLGPEPHFLLPISAAPDLGLPPGAPPLSVVSHLKSCLHAGAREAKPSSQPRVGTVPRITAFAKDASWQLSTLKWGAGGRSRSLLPDRSSVRHRRVSSLKGAFPGTARESLSRALEIISLDVPPSRCESGRRRRAITVHRFDSTG